MVSLVNSHANATSKRQHLWEIDLIFAPGLHPGWIRTCLSAITLKHPDALPPCGKCVVVLYYPPYSRVKATGAITPHQLCY